MKDLKISAELLSEVLKLEVVKHSLYNELHKSFNITYMQSEDSLKSSWMPINIYEFAFKCKEWALIRGYSLLSGRPIVRDEEGTQVFNYWYNCYIWEIDENSIDSPTQNTKIETNSETEPEAIIKACEWILKEQNNDTK